MTTLGTYMALQCNSTDPGIDLLNTKRLADYIRRGIGPKGASASPCDVTLPSAHNGPYTTPQLDMPWWVDHRRPESYDAIGLMPIKIDGLYDNNITRATATAGLGVVHTPIVDNGRTITVEALVMARTCCATAFFISALRQVLRDGCGPGQSAARLKVILADVDSAGACASSWSTIESGTAQRAQWRTMANAQLSEDVKIVSSTGPTCGKCGCDRNVVVRFSLRASAGLWHDSVQLSAFSTMSGADCKMLCEADCPTDLFPCGDIEVCPDWSEDPDPTMVLQDPRMMPVVRPPVPRWTAANWCNPVFTTQRRFVIDPGLDFDRTFPFELEPIVQAGSGSLRNFQLRVWDYNPGIPLDDSSYTSANARGGLGLTYVPKSATFAKIGIGDVATIRTVDGKSYRAERNLLGMDGGVYRGPIRLPGARQYLVEYLADSHEIAADASIGLWGAVVEP
jgi:hypothetical protein